MDSLTRSTWNNRIERESREGGSWELGADGGRKDCRPGTDSTKAEARGATAEAEAATGTASGRWASANERAGVTAEQIQRSGVQCSAVLAGGSEWTRAAGSKQRECGAVQCSADGGQRNTMCGGNGRRARGGEGQHAGRPGEGEGEI